MTEILGYIATAFSPGNLIFALVGTILGIIVGALPGFTPTMGIAVLIPVTYTIDSTTALVFLGAIYCGSMFGGSISAILINTPGTSAAAATAMDGYAMTLKGKSHEALVESAMSSFWGGIRPPREVHDGSLWSDHHSLFDRQKRTQGLDDGLCWSGFGLYRHRPCPGQHSLYLWQHFFHGWHSNDPGGHRPVQYVPGVHFFERSS